MSGSSTTDGRASRPYWPDSTSAGFPRALCSDRPGGLPDRRRQGPAAGMHIRSYRPGQGDRLVPVRSL